MAIVITSVVQRGLQATRDFPLARRNHRMRGYCLAGLKLKILLLKEIFKILVSFRSKEVLEVSSSFFQNPKFLRSKQEIMNVTFKFIVYFDIILSECGETKTKHSSCLFDENDKHRSAMSIKGMVTCNNINGSL